MSSSPSYGQGLDPTGAKAVAVLRKYNPPETVLNHPTDALFSTVKIAANYADRNKRYPVDTPLTAWVSAALYHDAGVTDEAVGAAIKSACEKHRLWGEWDRLKSAAAKSGDEVSFYALPNKRKYPLDTPDQVKVAYDYFLKYHRKLDDADRAEYAISLVKAAAAHPGTVPHDGMFKLEAEAGLGMPAKNWVKALESRVKMANIKKRADLSDALCKIIDLNKLDTGPKPAGTFKNAGELAELLRKVDGKMGFDFQDPINELVAETPSTAHTKMASMVRTPTGSWYRLEDLEKVTTLAGDVLDLGPIVSGKKMAALLQDEVKAAACEKLLQAEGVKPVLQERRRVDWTNLAANAEE